MTIIDEAAAILSRPRIIFDPGREHDAGPFRDPIRVGRGYRVVDGQTMTISGPYATVGAAMHRALWLASKHAEEDAARAMRRLAPAEEE